jgi:hypothetical protein
MTGGGRGYCAVPVAVAARRPLGMRRGAGYGYANRVATVPVQEQEIDTLKDEMQALKETLNRIESRIEKLTGK